ncbi:hypothetical protein DSO57_1012895 [Entomophthora muscae]|uniref:Uncharacterized protein n=1 Tax=Entomophthora muscae TaxID=34485 RepID=A0ACC2SJ93_9FUNG|nr:hypothetical protein DSO57_1012895 [Entomophthora muscae]
MDRPRRSTANYAHRNASPLRPAHPTPTKVSHPEGQVVPNTEAPQLPIEVEKPVALTSDLPLQAQTRTRTLASAPTVPQAVEPPRRRSASVCP